jgi:glycosyltransferase involved in cell wall biosynthesis
VTQKATREPRVTVIATVLNEAGSIDGLLTSLLEQRCPPDAVIIVDGGSTDGTLDILRRWEASGDLPLRVLAAPGANIAQGRNVAIDAAATEIVAATDAGTRLVPGWLCRLMAPFEEDPPPDVVAGFFVTDPQTTFEMALGATTIPVVDDVNADRFLPSSRSIAFRKTAWEALGGYPEWLDYSEDVLFDLWLRHDGYRVAFAPEAIAYFRPRRTLLQFARQYYRYARGDGKADLWPLRHGIRYATYLGVLPTLLGLARDVTGGARAQSGGDWAGSVRLAAWLALLGGAAVMFRPPLARLWRLTRGWPLARRLRAAAWIPVIRIAGDLAKMAGYPVGRWWRWRHRDTLRHRRSRPPFHPAQIFDRS